MRRTQVTIMAIALFTSVQSWAGLTIDYTVDGVAPIEFGGNSSTDPQHDTVTISGYSGSGLVLPDNTPVVAKINTMLLNIGYTSVQGQWTVPANRSMTITVPSGGSQALTQNLLVDSWFVNYPGDTVWTLPAGGTADFEIAGIGTVSVTPLAEGPFIHLENGDFSHDLSATFVFTPVPEPTTVLAGLMLLLPFGVSALRIVRRNKA